METKKKSGVLKLAGFLATLLLLFGIIVNKSTPESDEEDEE
jgi:hypothetical protein